MHAGVTDMETKKNVKYLSHFKSFKIEVYVLEKHCSSLIPSSPTDIRASVIFDCYRALS